MLARGAGTGPGQLDRGLTRHREHCGWQPQPGQQAGVTGGVRTCADQHLGSEPGENAR